MRRNDIIVWIVYILMRWMWLVIFWMPWMMSIGKAWNPLISKKNWSNAWNLIFTNLFCWMIDLRRLITWRPIWFIKSITFGALELWSYKNFKIFYPLMIMLSARRNAYQLHGIILLQIFLQLSSTRWILNISMSTSISCFYIKFYYYFKLIFFNIISSAMLCEH